MNVTIEKRPAFSLIGKEGSSLDDPMIAKRLWKEANEHFDEIAETALKDEKGRITHVWGAMSDFNHQLRPWSDGFSKGLYLAGVEVASNAFVPNGWVKWDIPQRTYMVVEIEDGKYQEAFKRGVYFELYYRRYKLAGAVCDYSDMLTGKDYLYFPIEEKPKKVYAEDSTDMIACCGIHCRYCFFDGACNGCMNEPNENSYGYYCDGRICTNIRCAKEKGLEGCYGCAEVMDCRKGFFKSSPYGKVMAKFISMVGKKQFEAVVKKMIEKGVNYTKDLEEMSDERRMAFLFSMLEK